MNYLSGRIHSRASFQQFLYQSHVAFFGCQVQSIESILQAQGPDPLQISDTHSYLTLG